MYSHGTHTRRPASCLSADVSPLTPRGAVRTRDSTRGGTRRPGTARPLPLVIETGARGEGHRRRAPGRTQTRGGTRRAPDLPLLLLPGGVQQQVAVPFLLLDHVLVLIVHVVVLHAGLDLVHGAGRAGSDEGRRRTRGDAAGRSAGRAGGDAAPRGGDRALGRREAPARAAGGSARLYTRAPSRGRASRPAPPRPRPQSRPHPRPPAPHPGSLPRAARAAHALGTPLPATPRRAQQLRAGKLAAPGSSWSSSCRCPNASGRELSPHPAHSVLLAPGGWSRGRLAEYQGGWVCVGQEGSPTTWVPDPRFPYVICIFMFSIYLHIFI